VVKGCGVIRKICGYKGLKGKLFLWEGKVFRLAYEKIVAFTFEDKIY